ncbi:CBS domain-containing protein [Halobacillus salinarum]|uniref:CBS domain-containing protein n=1 Tax=Halobacillus salinarum TaxID=2932257 RepID=A0ABY4EN55_9BACI|nr:CBS domain-containing protein [Halobacillus salinarum]UOQ45387.1 CBS domain-containing protein [Halobacillus salinarum]
MNDLVERFEIVFNQIHQRLKEFNGFPKNDNFVELLQRSKLKNSVIRVHFDELKQYAKLRNAIVHERIRDDYYIATPHEEVVEKMELIQRTLEQPPEAIAFSTKPVLFYKEETELTKIVEAFCKYGISQFPIYDDSHTFMGLLTNEGIVRWLSEAMDDGHATVSGVTARDVLHAEKDLVVEFLAARSTVFALEEMFETSLEAERKLKAVILTETGDPNEKPLGIVTTWDLIKVDRRPVDE